jgi:hypothetical protein
MIRRAAVNLVHSKAEVQKLVRDGKAAACRAIS